MNFSKGNFTVQDKIELLQRWVLVHSYLYYILDVSVVTDHKYDSNTRQLYEFKIYYPEDWLNSRYTYAMGEFDGSTGFGFIEKLKKKEMRSILFDVNMLCSTYSRLR